MIYIYIVQTWRQNTHLLMLLTLIIIFSGYMSLEYALEGLFSIKFDVFSFGVLLLEIVSGRKNTGFYQTDSFHLLGYVSILYTLYVVEIQYSFYFLFIVGFVERI